MPYGTSILQTSAAAEKVEAWLASRQKAKIVTAITSARAHRASSWPWAELPDPSFAKIVVRTDNPDEREALKHRLRKAIAEVWPARRRCASVKVVFGPYSPYPVAYRISGPDPQRLREIASEVRQVMDASPLMRTVNTDWGTRAPRCTSICSKIACKRWG